jgi:hypothetical protein
MIDPTGTLTYNHTVAPGSIFIVRRLNSTRLVPARMFSVYRADNEMRIFSDFSMAEGLP